MIHNKVKMILINIVIFSIFNQICYKYGFDAFRENLLFYQPDGRKYC